MRACLCSLHILPGVTSPFLMLFFFFWWGGRGGRSPTQLCGNLSCIFSCVILPIYWSFACVCVCVCVRFVLLLVYFQTGHQKTNVFSYYLCFRYIKYRPRLDHVCSMIIVFLFKKMTSNIKGNLKLNSYCS